ncbi:MAG TPA: hypothetical protein VGQ79_04000, partial [Nitrospiraceae bacterium]|nr:hypothetical protein [Nitrospiraceae bacterium]
RIFLFIRRTVVLTSLALIPWFPAPLAPAAELSPGGGIPEFMTMQPSMQRPALLMMTAPAQTSSAQATWVDEIKNSLGVYKANYPGSNFSPYQTKLNLVGDALSRGDRRAVKVEMGAFLKMLATRAHGINEGAADELSNFAQMVTPIQEYGISVQKSGAAQYGSEVPSSGSAQ